MLKLSPYCLRPPECLKMLASPFLTEKEHSYRMKGLQQLRNWCFSLQHGKTFWEPSESGWHHVVMVSWVWRLYMRSGIASMETSMLYSTAELQCSLMYSRYLSLHLQAYICMYIYTYIFIHNLYNPPHVCSLSLTFTLGCLAFTWEYHRITEW